MDIHTRIERGLERAVAFATATGQPPRLMQALRYAVFPGGARVRPRLCLAVASACGDPHPAASDAAAAAIELLHCASLVHDDMPCFDDAATRRGRPALHVVHGQPLALLTGDALIVLAFETLARECALAPDRLAPLTATVGRAVGSPHGIVAGQAWESESDIPLADYHRAKTTALFTGATAAGAIAAGADPQPWMQVGEALGAAYQTADDLRDIAAGEDEIGKPCGQDAANGRPNAALSNGVGETVARLQILVGAAVDAVPDCPGGPALRALILGEAKRLVPKNLAHVAA
ncbi:polyprenyl synthetase family protein [Stappia sp.]|uniref:polyprenyl synthetase family protein n=1 Tax=Stappia sp. TaxID=1870903 RepID=UPI0032D905DC